MHRVTGALIIILAGGARSTQRALGCGREPAESAVRTRDRAVGEDSGTMIKVGIRPRNWGGTSRAGSWCCPRAPRSIPGCAVGASTSRPATAITLGFSRTIRWTGHPASDQSVFGLNRYPLSKIPILALCDALTSEDLNDTH